MPRDVYLFCTDGLKGFPQAIESAFPKAQVQTCIVHLIRGSLSYASWRERKALAMDLKPVYRAVNAEEASAALADFRVRWPKHQVVADVWERNWERVIPFFQFPEKIRRVIYTTNALESLHMSLRKVTKNRGSFPSKEAAFQLLYLALRNAGKRWPAVQGWREAMRQFETICPGGERPRGRHRARRLPPCAGGVAPVLPLASAGSRHCPQSWQEKSGKRLHR